MIRLSLALSALGLATVANAWTSSNCKKFSEIYTDGEDLINRMWGDSFRYERDESKAYTCLLYTSPSPRDATLSRMPSSA